MKKFELDYTSQTKYKGRTLYRIKNPRNQGVSRFQSGEELVNSVGK